MAAHGVTVNLFPALSRPSASPTCVPARPGRDAARGYAAKRRDAVPALRFAGRRVQRRVRLCSVQAAYITGQNLLIDGGAYPGSSDPTPSREPSHDPSESTHRLGAAAALMAALFSPVAQARPGRQALRIIVPRSRRRD
jgi:hypothetical protein